MKRILAILLLSSLRHQPSEGMPLLYYRPPHPAPTLLFFISGDGGWNRFSLGLLRAWTSENYRVIGLDARAYFRKGQDPDAAAREISTVLESNLGEKDSLALIGYSFGADVMPFLYNRLPTALRQRVSLTVLMSPSHFTDFRIHANYTHTGWPVAEEVNRMSGKLVLLFGSEEPDPSLGWRKKPVRIRVPGGHHYGYRTAQVAHRVLDAFVVR